MVYLPYAQKALLNRELKARFRSKVSSVQEQLLDLLLGLGEDLFDFFGIFLGVVFEGGTDGAGDHALELELLLNFIAVVSN